MDRYLKLSDFYFPNNLIRGIILSKYISKSIEN